MLQQQAEHQSQKQKKAWTAMTMTTGYPGKQSAEEARKEHDPEPQSANNEKEYAARNKQSPSSDNNH
jgi:hypothetical protein